MANKKTEKNENDILQLIAKETDKLDETALQADEGSFSKAETVAFAGEAAKTEKKTLETALQAEKEDTVSGTESKRIYVYIGPSIKGVITNGSIFCKTKKEILKETEVRAIAAKSEDKMKHISRLIFSDKDVALAKGRLREGGNGLSIAYNAILTGKEQN